MQSFALSICIPTYNFGPFIGETLEAIEAQDLAGVEIVVLDSASTDNTPGVVSAFANRIPNLRYVRAEQKRGIDRDMARVVAEANGEYVWLFSADDIMRPNAIATVRKALPAGHDVLVCNHTNCDKHMRYMSDHPVVRAEPGETFDLGNAASRQDYFARAVTTEAFFSFMSGVIVKTSTWRTRDLDERFVGTCWAHVARLFDIIAERGMILQYLGGPLLDKRGDNDSFATGSALQRWRLAIEGYQRITATFFGGNSVEIDHVRRVLQAEFPLLSFLSLRFGLGRLPVPADPREVDALFGELFVRNTSDNARGRRIYRAASMLPGKALRPAAKLLAATGARERVRTLLLRFR